MRFTLKNPLTVILIFVCSLIITVSAMSCRLDQINSFQNIEGESILVNLKFEPGSSEEKSIKWINYVENKILDVNNKISDEFNNGNSLIRAV